MKKIALSIVLLISMLGTSLVYAASQPPVGLAGTITILAKDSAYVTIYAEQTGGTPVTLTLEHYCYANGVYAGMEKIKFVGSITTQFNIGPRTYHGQHLVPDYCHIELEYYYSSSRVDILDTQITVP